MRKTFVLSLDDEESVEFRMWLKSKGMSLSGFVNSIIKEQFFITKLLENPVNIDKISRDDLVGFYSRLVKNLEAEKVKS